MGSGLEQVVMDLPVPSPESGNQGLQQPPEIQGEDASDPQGSSHAVPSIACRLPEKANALDMSTQTVGQGTLGGGWKSQILSLDYVSFLLNRLLSIYNAKIVDRISKAKRPSTL